MIAITWRARRQVEELISFYVDEKNRPEAAERLLDDFARVQALIQQRPHGGKPHPGPYPSISQLGFRWLLARVYWVSWAIVEGQPVITNVLHESADIEGRASSSLDDVADW